MQHVRFIASGKSIARQISTSDADDDSGAHGARDTDPARGASSGLKVHDAWRQYRKSGLDVVVYPSAQPGIKTVHATVLLARGRRVQIPSAPQMSQETLPRAFPPDV